jgi:hypothetical protein
LYYFFIPFKVLVGLLVPFISFTIKFTSDEPEVKNSTSRNEVRPTEEVTDDITSDVTIPNGKSSLPVNTATDVDGRQIVTADGNGDGGNGVKKHKRNQLLTGNKLIFALYYFYTAPLVKFCYYSVS